MDDNFLKGKFLTYHGKNSSGHIISGEIPLFDNGNMSDDLVTFADRVRALGNHDIDNCIRFGIRQEGE